jgi:hypothetical protein
MPSLLPTSPRLNQKTLQKAESFPKNMEGFKQVTENAYRAVYPFFGHYPSIINALGSTMSVPNVP